MKLVYKGKTKDVFALDDGNYLLKFKDQVTSTNGVFDPGSNVVGMTIAGVGKSELKLTKLFMDIMNKKKIPTHFISADIENTTMTVLPAKLFGKGLECVCRYRAVGSFLRRYGDYCKEGQPLDAFVETTLKDDARDDPPITKDALAMLSICSNEEYETLKDLTKKCAAIVKEELKKKGLELYDIKFEFGRVGKDNHLALIDEISGGNMRAYKDGKYILPFDLEKIMLAK
jgi:phosphoribosylaminoimidazole-succinocarboxamide synthase